MILSEETMDALDNIQREHATEMRLYLGTWNLSCQSCSNTCSGCEGSCGGACQNGSNLQWD